MVLKVFVFGVSFRILDLLQPDRKPFFKMIEGLSVNENPVIYFGLDMIRIMRCSHHEHLLQRVLLLSILNHVIESKSYF